MRRVRFIKLVVKALNENICCYKSDSKEAILFWLACYNDHIEIDPITIQWNAGDLTQSRCRPEASLDVNVIGLDCWIRFGRGNAKMNPNQSRFSWNWANKKKMKLAFGPESRIAWLENNGWTLTRSNEPLDSIIGLWCHYWRTQNEPNMQICCAISIDFFSAAARKAPTMTLHPLALVKKRSLGKENRLEQIHTPLEPKLRAN